MGTSEVIEQLRSDIRDGEFNVAALVADQSSCDWAYSIGLTLSYGHPELLIVGLEASVAGMVVDMLGRAVAEGLKISPDDRIEAADSFVLEACTVDELWLARGAWFDLGREVMLGWGQRWPDTIQLLWPDADGVYPSVPGDPEWLLTQPLLASAARESSAGLTG
ncbi:MAG: DUF4262 domain-containing protein [Microthrixaceae bacterium]